MIRKDGTVSVRQIFKVSAFVRSKDKKGNWTEQYFASEVIIANPDLARARYEKMLSKAKFEMGFRKLDEVHVDCAFYVPLITRDGEIAYWPADEIFIERFKHNVI